MQNGVFQTQELFLVQRENYCKVIDCLFTDAVKNAIASSLRQQLAKTAPIVPAGRDCARYACDFCSELVDGEETDALAEITGQARIEDAQKLKWVHVGMDAPNQCFVGRREVARLRAWVPRSGGRRWTPDGRGIVKTVTADGDQSGGWPHHRCRAAQGVADDGEPVVAGQVTGVVDEGIPLGTGRLAVAAQVVAQHLRHAAEPELRGAVGRVPRHRDDAGGRGHVDQLAAAPSVDHRGHELLDDVDRAHQVDVDHRLPVLVLQVLHGAPGRDSGTGSGRNPCGAARRIG